LGILSYFQSVSSKFGRPQEKGSTTGQTTVKKSSTRASSFNPALSGLRGIASFGVVLFHEGTRLNIISLGRIQLPIDDLAGSFFVGVPVFLMMSMYLLLSRLDANSNLKHYFRRRIIRIWPIYYGTLIVAYLLFPYPIWDFVRYLFFVEYYVNPFGYFPVTIFWTLQLEEAAYLLIPLIHKLHYKTALGLGLVLGGFSYLTWMTFTSSAWLRPIYTLQVFLPIPLIGYGFGILVYTGMFNSSKFRWLAVAGVAGYTLFNIYYSGSYIFGAPTSYFVYNVALYAVALTGFAYIVARPPVFLGWFTFLGEESYALYAVHYALVVLFGLWGIAYAVVLAFMVELSVRPREFVRRISLGYKTMLNSAREGPPLKRERDLKVLH
jgi:peptidoglycan/LPS O-acetylase OafA/YrhL